MSAPVTRRHREQTAFCHPESLWAPGEPYPAQLRWIDKGDEHALRSDEKTWPAIAQALADIEAEALASRETKSAEREHFVIARDLLFARLTVETALDLPVTTDEVAWLEAERARRGGNRI